MIWFVRDSLHPGLRPADEPLHVPGAELAWTAAWPETEYTATAYSKQWTNPRPEVVIESVDMIYGQERRGVPVLLALTAADIAP